MSPRAPQLGRPRTPVPYKVNFDRLVAEYERQLIETALEATDGCIMATSRVLSINTRTLYRAIKRLLINVDAFRDEQSGGDEA